jgi:hypothetical protein
MFPMRRSTTSCARSEKRHGNIGTRLDHVPNYDVVQRKIRRESVFFITMQFIVVFFTLNFLLNIISVGIAIMRSKNKAFQV